KHDTKVTIYQSGDPTRWISGKVTDWTRSTGNLTISLTGGAVVGSGTMGTPIVGYGWVTQTDYYVYTGSQTRLDYTYNSSGSVITTTDFYKECNSAIGSSPGSSKFTRVTLTEASPQAQNYANWVTYYQTRMQMMKTSASLAFKGIDNRYRIGYSTISKEEAAEDDDFLHIRDFDSSQKSSFYTKLNTANPNSSTPLRGALSKAGQYFARKARNQGSNDPMQYSCQRNFTILSTDGYWNTGGESTSSPRYGPYKLNNTDLVGQQDGGTTKRPMYDGQSASATSTANSLADVAMYYYETDLRTPELGNCDGAISGVSVCTNNVPGSKGDAARSFGDSATHQHMTTFTLGMGLSGRLRFDPNYMNQLSGDFYDILSGAKNWPTPVADKPEALDDLWHAAVNGRGQFFSASDPASLLTSLTSALSNIEAKVGSASAASTSTLRPVPGDNDVFTAQFTTQKWIGDVISYTIDPDSGVISTTPTWSASAQLATKSAAARTIYYRNPNLSQTPRAFTAANLATDGYASHFTNFCSKTAAGGTGAPEQCALLVDPTNANTAANLVAYLRGEEKSYYRARESKLGDIINAAPLFVGKPAYTYTENNYAAFATANANRQGLVVAAANDGMVHAFSRTTGEELWAYIPTFALPNLYKLADTGFTNNHTYFVDSSPQVADIYAGGQWRTIVVGGLGKGGRGYYALDVTVPTEPKVLWEFSADNLGLTYGHPVITKRADGTWIVAFGSGYNNVSPGDGNGYLFVLNAYTGAQILAIPTQVANVAVGNTTTPSGLTKIVHWVDSESNNTVRRFYGGDLLGNAWRFDIDNAVQPHGQSMRLAQLTNTSGGAQPITTTPVVAEVIYNGTRYPVVYFATGRYLGIGDLSDTSTQSVYAIKDPLTTTSWGVARTNPAFVQQTFTIGANDVRSATNNTVNWGTQAGWRADFPASGERVNVDPELVLNTLTIGSNQPNAEACSVGGTSYIYNLNINTGSAAAGETHAGYAMTGVLVQGLTVVQLRDGSTETIITRSDAKLDTEKNNPVSAGSVPWRTSWRELAD
ncbi:pilus assembly protein, partial [Ramlibacter sp.]|uniref:pilus assembly protein n=1 Tax=Ramlibacter sp. TaxID=1917967 RepID=UPI003D0B14BE